MSGNWDEIEFIIDVHKILYFHVRPMATFILTKIYIKQLETLHSLTLWGP